MIRLLALLSLAIWSMQAVAAPAAAKPWPREVQAVYDQLKSECRANGGKFIPDRDHFATATEITNDGKDDWVVEYASTRCSTSGYSEWCGTAGCVIAIFGSGKAGLKEIFNDNVHGWRAADLDKKRKGLVLATHGGQCGSVGADVCIQTLAWDGRKLALVSSKRGGDDPLLHGDENAGAPPPVHSARWQFAGTGPNAIAAVTGHPDFVALGMRCAPGGGVYMTVVPNKAFALPPAGRPLLLTLSGSENEMEATQTLAPEPGKPDFSGMLDGPVHTLLTGRDSELTLLVSRDGGDEWQELPALSLGGSTAAIRSLEKQCASAAGTASTTTAAGKTPLAPLGIVAGYYVDEATACGNPITATYYDGKRWGVLYGGKPGSEDENYVAPLGKVEKMRGGGFFLPTWETEVAVLSPTRIQLTIQDTGAPQRLCPAEQIPANFRVR